MNCFLQVGDEVKRSEQVLAGENWNRRRRMTYQEFKEAVIGSAKEQQITDYELYYTMSESTSVEIYKEEVKGYSTEGGMGVCFRCIVDGKAGYASTENLTEEEAQSLVHRALENAASIESEEPCFLHKKGDTYAVCQKEDSVPPTGADLTEAALKIQRKMYQADKRVADGTQAYATYGGEKYALYNSNGLDLEDEAYFAACYGMPLVEDGGEKYDGFKVKQGRLAELDLDAIAKDAVEEATSAIGAGSVASGSYSIVFSNEVMATLLSAYVPVFSAEEAQKGMSLLAGKEGEKIAADIITITDDPRYKDSVVKRTFDGEGVAAYAKNIIEKGTLNTLLHNLKTAAKAGCKSTGNASKASYASVVGISPFTIYIQPVEGTKEELMELAGNGVYVTEVSGLHAGTNSVTGDFSLASKGFLIENGRKTAPVKNFTVSGNFFTLLVKIERVGTDLDFLRSRFGSPSVLVREMAVAGK